MKSKERVIRALEFNSPDRLPIGKSHMPSKGIIETLKVFLFYPNDIGNVLFRPANTKAGKGVYKDNWGVLWHKERQVIESPLKDWSGLDNLKVPNYFTKSNFAIIKTLKFFFKNRFVLGDMHDMIFSRMQYLRGYEQFMEDLYLERENIEKLADKIIALNIEVINKYADLGVDGVLGFDDLGLQDRLMISPDMWREIFKPKYKVLIEAAHARGLKFILHSCGYIYDIIEDFIEIKLDALQCDQQDNMGVDKLNEKYGGRITFFSPVDVQTSLSTNDYEKITKKTKYLKNTLGSHNGGLIGKVYNSPKALGANEKSVRVMLDAFLDK